MTHVSIPQKHFEECQGTAWPSVQHCNQQHYG